MLWRKHRGRWPGCPTSQELCSQSRFLRAQQALLLRGPASAPKATTPQGTQPPAVCGQPSRGLHGEAGLEPKGTSRHPCQAPAQPVFSVRSCCQVRKHCEWCQALICRHEKPSALLKGRTACCHSETGKGLRRGGPFSLWRHSWVEQSTAFSRAGQTSLGCEAGRGFSPPKSGLVYPKVCFTQKEALLA